MKKFRFILSLVVLLSLSNLAFAQKQNAAIEEKATELVDKLAGKLQEAEAAPLTADQKEQVHAAYVQQQEQLRAINKGAGTDEEKKEQQKAVRKETNQHVNKTILTKEQRQALSGGNKEKSNPKPDGTKG